MNFVQERRDFEDPCAQTQKSPVRPGDLKRNRVAGKRKRSSNELLVW